MSKQERYATGVISSFPGEDLLDSFNQLSEADCSAWVRELEHGGRFSLEISEPEAGVTRVTIQWRDWLQNVLNFDVGRALWHEIAMHLIYTIGCHETGREFVLHSLRKFLAR